MSDCSIKFKTIKHLQSKGVINDKREVIDLSKFDKINDDLTTRFYKKYEVGNGMTKLFNTENKYVSLADGRKRFLVRAIPNEKLFDQAEEFNNQEEETIISNKTTDELNSEIKNLKDKNSKIAKDLNKEDSSFQLQLEFDKTLNDIVSLEKELESVQNKSQFDKNSSKLQMGTVESGNSIIDSIIDISDKNFDSNIFMKGVAFKTKKDPAKTSLKTIDEKMANTIENISSNIKEALDKSEFFLQRTKDEDIQKRLNNYIDKVKNTLNEIQNYAYVNQIKSITTFLDFMESNLKNIKARMDSMPDNPTRQELTDLTALYDNYLKVFSVIDNVSKTIASVREEHNEDLISKDDLNKLEESLYAMSGQYQGLNNRINDLKRKALKQLLNDIKWFPQVEKEHYDRLAKEYKDSKIIEDKDTWIIDKMQNRDAELIKESVENAVDEFLENSMHDIMANTMVLNSPINTSSSLIQIAHQMLNNINNDRLNEELKKDKEFQDLFNELRKEKDTNNIKKLYENILQFDSNGKAYILGDYDVKFYTDVHLKLLSTSKEYNDKMSDTAVERNKAEMKYGRTSKQWKDLNVQYIKLKNDKKKALQAIKDGNIIMDKKGKSLRPADKWKNKKKLTSTEQKVKDFFIDIINTSMENTYGVDPLITFSHGARFYELPKITKSDKERAFEGNVKGILSDKYKDLTELRSDDVNYVERYVDQNNEVIKKLRIHYRNKGNFDPKDQSLDLFSIFRLEYKNTNRYKHRKEYETELNFLLDIAKNKTYYQREGTRLVYKKNTKKYNEIAGKESNTYKMLSNMLESRFYDINKRHNLKMGSVDVNKAISFINKGSSALALSLNYASGTANVVNANAQLFLESFIKGKFITAKGIKKANEIYAKNIDKTVTDNTKPINKSYVNKINEFFNVWGRINFSNSDFLRSDMLKKGFSRQSLQVFQDSGEHWIQSVITMSVLDGVKVLNKDGKFIDKNGNVVEKKKAASLLDMLKNNEEADILEVDEKVVYTTHSRLTKWNEGGKDKVDSLIHKKIYDSVGNYRDIDQPDIMRQWYGPLLFLFRRYLIPMGVSRLRGIAYSYKDKNDLTEEQMKFSYALQEYEEGTYTSFLRYAFTKFKDMRYYLLSLNKPDSDTSLSTGAWNTLSDYEKHNIKRAVTELVMTWGLLPLAVQFVAAAADDADSEYLFFLAYQMRRLDTELSQYRSIEESFKVMRSPIPSARLIETTGDIFLQILSPWQWHTLDDVYKAGYNKGENKLATKIQKQIPLAKEFKRTYQDLYDFQNSTYGTGL